MAWETAFSPREGTAESKTSPDQTSAGNKNLPGNGLSSRAGERTEPDSRSHGAAHFVPAPALVDDDDLAKAQLEYEMALKQAEILRLRHMTRKLEHELQSTSRTLSTNAPRLSPALALADTTDHQSKTGSKRSASEAATPSESHDWVPRTFEGKSLRSLRSWTVDVQDHFARHAVPDATRVEHALKYATSNIQQQWQNYNQHRGDAGQCSSWEDFVEYLASHFGNPEERRMIAMQAYHDAMPRPKECVEHFKAYLQSLEADLPPYTEEQRALHLQCRLRMTAQQKPPAQTKPAQTAAPGKKGSKPNRAAQWSSPRGPRHPSQSRGGRNTEHNKTAHPRGRGRG